MSRLILNEQSSAPSTPAAGKVAVYANESGQLVTLDDAGIARAVGRTGPVNAVRNSAFWFAQRQTPGTLTTYSHSTQRMITADGWGITCENASIQYRRVDTASTPETGHPSRYYGEYTKITSTGKITVTQFLEAATALPYRGRKVRLTAKLKGVIATPTIRMSLVQVTSAGNVDNPSSSYLTAHGANGTDPTMGTNFARITPSADEALENTTIDGDAAEAVLTTSWQKFSAVFFVPTDCKNLVIDFHTDSGIAATNGFAIGEVMLTDGIETQEFAPQSWQEELDRVQRFYVKTFGLDTAPVQGAGVSSGQLRCTLGKAGATALAAQFQWRFPCRMRTNSPTVTLYNPVSANAQVRQIGGTASDLTATASAVTEQALEVTATGVAAGAVGDQCGIHATVDAEL